MHAGMLIYPKRETPKRSRDALYVCAYQSEIRALRSRDALYVCASEKRISILATAHKEIYNLTSCNAAPSTCRTLRAPVCILRIAMEIHRGIIYYSTRFD